MKCAVEVIVNCGSGKDKDADELQKELAEVFRAHDLEANISIAATGEQLLKLAEKAASGDAEIICAGGGDGTISAVAASVIKHKKTLGVLPLGTLNHFSKDLNIPQDLNEAVKIIRENEAREIDAGAVNGQIFINNSSIGLYPRLVKNREFQQERLGRGKWHAAFWALVNILRRHSFLHLNLGVEGEKLKRRTPFVFVGNNRYEMNFLDIGTRGSLDDGKLSIYLLHKSGRRGLLALFLRAAFGRLREAEDFEEIETGEITIETRRKEILVAFDGEVRMMKPPLHYKILPKALRVIAPLEDESEPSAVADG